MKYNNQIFNKNNDLERAINLTSVSRVVGCSLCEIVH